MALYKVDETTADLTKVAGGTLYADLPIGSWVKNDMATIPSGFLKEGDTITQSEYPELYAKYGPTVPYKADTSELSEYENITLSTDSSNPTVMPYDGVYILANYGVLHIHHIWLNGSEISGGITGNNMTGASTSSTIRFKKGDKMYRLSTYTESVFLEHVAYYKKSLIVKAKHTPVPADFMDAVDDAISDTTVDTVADGNMHPVTSNAVYDKLNTKQDVIETITVHADTWRNYTTFENRYTDWVQGEIIRPTIPSGYIALRYFAEVSEVQNGHVDCYPTSTSSNGIPNCVGINTDGQVTTCKLRLGAICIKL